MTKHFILLLFSFISFHLASQDLTGKMKITLKDGLTGNLLSSAEVTLALNSDTMYVATDAGGEIFTRELNTGKYAVYVHCDTYVKATIYDIVVGEGKTVYITMMLRPDRVLTKKEKEYLGLGKATNTSSGKSKHARSSRKHNKKK